MREPTAVPEHYVFARCDAAEACAVGRRALLDVVAVGHVLEP